MAGEFVDVTATQTIPDKSVLNVVMQQKVRSLMMLFIIIPMPMDSFSTRRMQCIVGRV